MTDQNKEELLQEEPLAEEENAGQEADEDNIAAAAEETVEQAAEEPPEAAADDAVVQLVGELKDAIKARNEWEDRYLRAAAEFSNARRRAELRADSEVRASRERLLNSIIPIVDDFERAFQLVPENETDSTWVEGFTLILRKLQGALLREGVTVIEAEGKPFDPSLHQAVMVEEVDGAEPDTVVEVLQRGYLLDDRVLRPAMVKVAQ
ncbi:MAG: nucleotide exchange factor GrpE [Anaerolineae bacterium]|nr:nucleotide exchange factor GrpE [Anaerolineae bacterium]